jgi:DNA invertase Pin-like site-specific DNA recombinase
MSAIGYCRVSKKELATGGISLEVQATRIRSYAAANGITLESILIDDGISGSIPLRDRPQGKRIFDRMEYGQCGDVIAVKLDRLFRDTEDALRTTREWDNSKIGLHIIDFGGQAINTGTAMGRVFLTMLAGFAELERNLIAERTTTALRYKRDNGFVYSPIPYGFTRAGDRLVADAKEQGVLDNLRAIRPFTTLAGLANGLNLAGVPAKNGGKWHPSAVRSVLRRAEVAKRVGPENVTRFMP